MVYKVYLDDNYILHPKPNIVASVINVVRILDDSSLI